MRYRPYGIEGRSVSSVAVQLSEPRPGAGSDVWRARIQACLQRGVTGFEVVTPSQALAQGLGAALAPLERSQYVVIWRIRATEQNPVSGLDIAEAMEQALDWTGLPNLDALMLEWDAYKGLQASAWEVLNGLARAGAFDRLGIVGGEQAVDLCLSDRRFRAIKTFYDIAENPAMRRKIGDAARIDTAVFVRAIVGITPKAQAGKSFMDELGEVLGLRSPEKTPRSMPLEFLWSTPGWTADEMTLACLMADPAVTAAVYETLDAKVIGDLSQSSERDLPKVATAQLEMSRIAGARIDRRRDGQGRAGPA